MLVKVIKIVYPAIEGKTSISPITALKIHKLYN